ncbi:MAG: hypothetical protein QXH08_06490 [Candidatus Hadarchaeales archaeon]
MRPVKICPTKDATLFRCDDWEEILERCNLHLPPDQWRGSLYPNLAIMPAGGRFISFGRGDVQYSRRCI